MKILDHLDFARTIVRGQTPFPFSFEIDPSNTCNHDCVWCMYSEFMNKEKGIIDRNTFRSIVDEVISLGARSITLTGGGEPLTNPHTVELIPYIKRQGVSVALITNGGLLDDEKCRVMVENCSYIRVSVDAGCRETHHKLHRSKNPGHDNYDEIMANICRLVEWKKRLGSDIEIGTGYLVNPTNTKEIFPFVEQIKAAGADYVQIRPVCNSNGKHREVMISESTKQIETALKMSGNGFNIFPMLTRFDEIRSIERNYDICRGHALVGIIGADCNVYLCCQLKGNMQYSLGNLKENSFEEIWLGQSRERVVRWLNPAKCPPCRYNKYNEILEYLSETDKLHTEFL